MDIAAKSGANATADEMGHDLPCCLSPWASLFARGPEQVMGYEGWLPSRLIFSCTIDIV